jgi:hypothetical protein
LQLNFQIYGNFGQMKCKNIIWKIQHSKLNIKDSVFTNVQRTKMLVNICEFCIEKKSEREKKNVKKLRFFRRIFLLSHWSASHPEVFSKHFWRRGDGSYIHVTAAQRKLSEQYNRFGLRKSDNDDNILSTPSHKGMVVTT